MGKKHINHTITSNEGCKFHIVGDVSYSIIPPSLNGFSGTITMSGKGKCPNETVTFGIADPGNNGSGTDNFDKDIFVTMDNRNIYKMQEIEWKKNLKPVPKQLDTKAINETLLAEFKSLEVDMKKEYLAMEEEFINKETSNKLSVNVNVNCG